MPVKKSGLHRDTIAALHDDVVDLVELPLDEVYTLLAKARGWHSCRSATREDTGWSLRVVVTEGDSAVPMLLPTTHPAGLLATEAFSAFVADEVAGAAATRTGNAHYVLEDDGAGGWRARGRPAT